MAASAGTVTLDLDANSVKMIRELQRAQKQTKKSAYAMRNDMKNAFKQMGRAAVGFGVALAAASKVSIDFADKIGKTAKATGLTAEKFQELSFAAKRSGVETSLFNSSMVAFVKRVGEAGAGMGPLTSGLKNLNPELLQAIINAKDQAEALGILADGVQNAKSATERAAITNAAFGRSGVVMVNMLRDGSAGLDSFAAKARSLGVVMDNRLIANAEEAADKMGDLQKVLQVSIATQVTENADSIIALTEALISFITAIGRATQGWNAFLAEMGVGVNSIEDVRRRGAELLEEKQRLEAELGNSNGPGLVESLLGIDDQGDAAIKNRLAEIREEMLELQDLGKKMQAVAGIGGPAPTEPTGETSGAGADGAAAGPSKYNGPGWLMATKELEKSLEFINTELEHRADLESEYQALVEQTQTPLEAHVEKINRITFLYEEGIIPSAEEYMELVQSIQEEFNKTQERAEGATDQIDQFALQGARNLQSAFADFLFNPFDEGVEGMLKNFASVVQRMIAEAAAAQILKSLFGDGGTGDAAGGLGSIFAGIFGGGKALGGPISAGTPYLVGERGPELIVPQSSGTVIPNDHLGGKTIVNNFNFRKDPRRKALSQEAAEINRLQKRASARNA